MEKGEPSYTAGRNVNQFNHRGKQYGGSSKKLKIEIPFDPGLPLLGIYPRNAGAQFEKDICTPMFIAALFTIANTWK